jgi:hypothetical protein
MIFVSVGLGIFLLTSITCNFVFGLMPSNDAEIRTIIGQVMKNIFKSNDESSTTPITGQIRDSVQDWLHNPSNITRNITSTTGDLSTDIIAVDYTNNGRFLNATLWLFAPVKAKPPQNEEIRYGMLIDSGPYQLEVGFDNKSQTWKRTMNSYSPTGDLVPMEMQQDVISFSKRSVRLSLDLNSIRHEDSYKVVFYAKANRNASEFIDLTNSLNFPPLDVSISASPPSVTLRPGESNIIGVKLNSTRGYEPRVQLLAVTSSSDIVAKFGFNETRIPSYGMATVPLAITVPYNFATSDPRQYTISIFANATLPVEYLDPSKLNGYDSQSSIPLFRTQPTSVGYTMTVEVLPAMTVLEKLGLGSSGIPLNIPKEYLLGFYGIVLSLVVPGITRWFNKRRQMTYVNRYMTSILSEYDSKKQNKDECLRSLENIRRQVDLSYAKGRLDESNYKILNGKISEYQKHFEPQFDTKDDQKRL